MRNTPLPHAANRQAVMSTTVVLWLLASLSMLQPLSTDMYLPSLPAIAQGLAVSAAEVQWTLSIFVIGFGAWQLVAGPTADRFGRKPVVLAGTATFFAASLLCALAPTLDVLIVGRLLQAVGACSCLVGARGLLRDLYVPSEGARLLSRAATLLAFAPLIAPLAGAAMLTQFGWRATFVALVLFGAGLTCFALLRLVETLAARVPHALALGPMFATYARIARSPVFCAYTLATAASWSTMFAFLSGSPFVMTRVHGLTPTQYSVAFAIVTSGFFVGTLIGRRLVGHRGIQRTVMVGAALHLVAGSVLATLAVAGFVHPAAFVAPIWFHACAHAIVTPTGQAGAIAPFAGNAGAASALLGFSIMWIAAGVGFVVGATYDGTVLPLTLIMGALAWIGAAITLMLVRRHGDVSHHG